MLTLIEDLESENPRGIVCKLVPSASLDRFDASRSAQLATQPVAPRDETPNWSWLPRSASASGTGLAFIYRQSDGGTPTPLMALAPPFPIRDEFESNSLEPLRRVIDSDLTIGVILVRLGRFAVGVARNEKLLVSKSDTRYVRGRHRAGGQSANRFKRNREKWMREFFDKTATTANAVFGSYGQHIDWISMGGDENVIKSFFERASFPDDLGNRVLARRVPVSRPGRDALERAARDVWGWRVYELTPRPVCNPD